MNKSEKLNIPFQVKSNLATYKEVDEQNRTIKAVANTLNYFDHDYDVLRPGVANKSINERGANSKADDKILHLLFHDMSQMVGKSTIEKEQIINGVPVLYVESFLPETTDGENTLIKYNSGIYNQHSIGFSYTQLEYVEKDSSGWGEFLKDLINPEDAEKVGFGWNVKEINWYEWSTVGFGANSLTPYLGTKSANKAVILDGLYKKLDAIIKKAKRFDIKDKKMFELQYRQLKQMIAETLNDIPQKDKKIPEKKGVTVEQFRTLLHG